MEVTFKYSLIEEIKTLYDFVFHYEKIRGLRSIVFPSLPIIFRTKINQKKTVQEVTDIWESIRHRFDQAMKETGLDWEYGLVTGYIHTFRCEGWFNVLKSQIHVRVTDSTKRNTAETVVHELLHLITFNDHTSYKEREELVDKYIEKPFFRDIIMSVSEE